MSMNKIVQFLTGAVMIITIMGVFSPLAAASAQIVISPTEVTSGQQVTVGMQGLPVNGTLDLTVTGTSAAKPDENIQYVIDRFYFPFVADSSTFVVKNLKPGTIATLTVTKDDGTEGSHTLTVGEDGVFTAPLSQKSEQGYYTLSFVGTPAQNSVSLQMSLEAKTGSGGASEVSFSPSGFSEGSLDVSISMDGTPIKEQTITMH